MKMSKMNMGDGYDDFDKKNYGVEKTEENEERNHK